MHDFVNNLHVMVRKGATFFTLTFRGDNDGLHRALTEMFKLLYFPNTQALVNHIDNERMHFLRGANILDLVNAARRRALGGLPVGAEWVFRTDQAPARKNVFEKNSHPESTGEITFDMLTAVKEVREKYGLGLKDAKNAVIAALTEYVKNSPNFVHLQARPGYWYFKNDHLQRRSLHNLPHDLPVPIDDVDAAVHYIWNNILTVDERAMYTGIWHFEDTSDIYWLDNPDYRAC